MPIYHQKNISSSSLILWKISETLTELMDIAKVHQVNIELIPNTKNELRKKHWIISRIITAKNYPKTTILYDEFGKPFLDNGKKISISHSKHFVAVYLSHNNCGIDIEEISEKVNRIKHKFLNQKDLNNLSTLKELTIYWCAKETLYKYYGEKNVLFIENLGVENFNLHQNHFTGIINLANHYAKVNLYWKEIENFILVYTIK